MPELTPLEQQVVHDLKRILRQVPDLEFVVALIHHRGKTLAHPVLHSAKEVGIALDAVMTVVPDPDKAPEFWREIPEGMFRPRGAESSTMAGAYLVRGRRGNALAFRRNGQLQWIASTDHINKVQDALVEAGCFVHHSNAGVN